MKSTNKQNIAYIDAQNLYMGTNSSNPAWTVDFVKFRTYLREKYGVVDAYYFLGFTDDNYRQLYIRLQKAGFILVFREHTALMKSNKKGNVDSDIILHAMTELYKGRLEDKGIVLVSNDGDFFSLIDFLRKEGKLTKVLHPSRKFASSLYKKLGSEYYDYLDRQDIKTRIKK